MIEFMNITNKYWNTAPTQCGSNLVSADTNGVLVSSRDISKFFLV